MISHSDPHKSTRQLEPIQRVNKACGREYVAVLSRLGWRVYYVDQINESSGEIFRTDSRRLTHRVADQIEKAVAIDRLYGGKK